MKFLDRVLGRDVTADDTATKDDTGSADEGAADGRSPAVEPDTTSKVSAEAQQGPGPAAGSATTAAVGDGQPETSSVSVVVSEHGASAASDIGAVAVGADGAAAASEVGTAAVGPDAGAATSNAAGSTTVSVHDATEGEEADDELDENESGGAAPCEPADDG